jgi:hypothetical protein
MKDKERYRWLVEPYMKTTAMKWLEECNVMNRPPESGRRLDFERVDEVLRSLVKLPETNMHKTDCETALNVIYANLKELEQQHPDAYLDTLGLVEHAALLGWMVAESILLANHFDQASRFKPIGGMNAAKASAVERAQAIATELWQADIGQTIRVGDMADRVYRALTDEGLTESLPGTAERLKEWIKPVAPDYARKGGRRRKNP